MKVGDYVRFYDRSWTEIGQIVGEAEDSHLKVVKCKDGYYDLDNFIKSSPNIIDLIEVGDYVNGYKVLFVGATTWDNDGNVIDKRVKINYDNYDRWLSEDFIKSILTKEQFSQMEYKVD